MIISFGFVFAQAFMSVNMYSIWIEKMSLFLSFVFMYAKYKYVFIPFVCFLSCAANVHPWYVYVEILPSDSLLFDSVIGSQHVLWIQWVLSGVTLSFSNTCREKTSRSVIEMIEHKHETQLNTLNIFYSINKNFMEF